MTTFVLIPGAGGQASFWRRLVPELRSRGHRAIAVDLPAGDDSAGLAAYADAVVRSVDVPGPVTLVAQSLGGMIAPLVCDRLDVEQIVLVNAMTPSPGETGADWWATTGQAAAARAYAEQQGRDPASLDDPWETFLHDADPQLLAEAKAAPGQVQSGRPMQDPWPLGAWPRVPTRFLAARDDRLFPLDFQRRVVAGRLGLEVEATPGGHLSSLTQPVAMAELLTEGRPRGHSDEGSPVNADEGAPETKGVTAELLGTVDLGPEIDGMEGRRLRLRRFTFEPGAVFGPVHDHKGRPGLVYILQGTITDHRNGVATDYGPGLGWPEDRNTVHWLENRGTVPAVEVSVDIVKD